MIVSGIFLMVCTKKQGRRQRGSTYVQHMVQRNNLQEHLGHNDNVFIWKGLYKSWNNRNINTASPEYIAFHSIQCCSRVTQIFFLFLFCFWTTWRRKDHNQDLCWQRENKKHKKTPNAEWFMVQNQESAYVRSRRKYAALVRSLQKD